MVCQFCKQKEATVHLTQIIENQVNKVDFCESCAKAKGVSDPTAFEAADVLLGLGASKKMDQAMESRGGDVRCPTCGYTQGDFKKTGRLGCSDCYTVFAEGLESMLKSMHKGTHHRGKVPPRIQRAASRDAVLTRLQSQLQEAIGCENFEKAAKLRDEIKGVKAGSGEVSS